MRKPETTVINFKRHTYLCNFRLYCFNLFLDIFQLLFFLLYLEKDTSKTFKSYDGTI